MKKQITFDQRINQLKMNLQATADAHGELLEDLRPKEPHRWADEDMMEPCEDATKWLREYGFKK